MSLPSYAAAPFPVGEALESAHRAAWQHLARPGAWWRGAERVAIAEEVRRSAACSLCRERRAALSPHAGGESHEARGPLSADAVDAVHRITSDPGRLSRSWFEKLQAGGLAEGAYAELVGVVVTVVSVDSFCRGLGTAPHPLPEPEDGEPSRYRPSGARSGEAWVAMLPRFLPAGAESDLWRGGRTANVMRALTLVPEEVRNLKRLSAAHYLEMEQVADPRASREDGALDRRQVELLAARVSALRECFY